MRFALSDACTAEVLVIDDSSTDATAELARLLLKDRSDFVKGRFGRGGGRGSPN